VLGCCECSDEPLGSGTTELVQIVKCVHLNFTSKCVLYYLTKAPKQLQPPCYNMPQTIFKLHFQKFQVKNISQVKRVFD
jgi:hypothetical protein